MFYCPPLNSLVLNLNNKTVKPELGKNLDIRELQPRWLTANGCFCGFALELARVKLVLGRVKRRLRMWSKLVSMWAPPGSPCVRSNRTGTDIKGGRSYHDTWHCHLFGGKHRHVRFGFRGPLPFPSLLLFLFFFVSISFLMLKFYFYSLLSLIHVLFSFSFPNSWHRETKLVFLKTFSPWTHELSLRINWGLVQDALDYVEAEFSCQLTAGWFEVVTVISWAGCGLWSVL